MNTQDWYGHIVKVYRAPIWHYGVVDLDGMIWEHAGKEGGECQRVSPQAFSRGSMIHVEEQRNPEISASDAIDRFLALRDVPYKLMAANCEQRVRWAVLGEWKCSQLNRLGAAASIGAGIGAIVSDGEELGDIVLGTLKGATVGVCAVWAADIIAQLLSRPSSERSRGLAPMSY